MIRIEPMTEQQVAQVAELEKRCFRDPWSENSIRYELSNPLAYWLVALDGDRVAGYIGSQSVPDEADMMNVAVDPRYRRRGVGERLVAALEAALKEKGIRSLALEVRVSNTPAVSLYEKLGFSPVGRRPNYYRNPREDAWIMKKEWSL